MSDKKKIMGKKKETKLKGTEMKIFFLFFSFSAARTFVHAATILAGSLGEFYILTSQFIYRRIYNVGSRCFG